MSFSSSWIYQIVDKFSGPAEKINRAARKINQSVKSNVTNFKKAEISIDQLQSKMAQFAAIAGTTFALSLPIQQAIKFEAAMADVNKVIDFKRPDGLRLMGKDILELSKQIPISAEGLADIAAAGGQFGIAEENILKFTKTVSKMATAFDLAPGEAGSAVAKLSKIFEIPVNEFEGFADTINFVSNNVAASADEIIRSLQNKGAAAGRALGFSAEDTLGLATTFITLGVNADRVGSIMDSMSRRLSDVSIVGKQFSEQFTKKPRETLIALLRKINEMPAGAKKAQALSDIFGEFSGRIGLLADTMDNGLIPTLAKANDKIGSAGSVTKEFENRSATTDAQIKIMRNTINALAVNLGTVLLPAVNIVLHGINKFAEAIAFVHESTGPLIPGLLAVATGLLVLKAAAIAGQVAMMALNFAMAANPIGLVIVGIAALVGWVIAAKEKFGSWSEAIISVGRTIIDFLVAPLRLVLAITDKLFGTTALDNFNTQINAMQSAAASAVGLGTEFASVVKVERAESSTAANGNISGTIDVNLNAPDGVVSSISARGEGGAKLNVGQNLAFAG